MYNPQETEKSVLSFWKENDTFNKLRKKNEGKNLQKAILEGVNERKRIMKKIKKNQTYIPPSITKSSFSKYFATSFALVAAF